MRIAVVASALLAIGGLAAFWYASGAKRSTTSAPGDSVTVTIRDKVCEPNELTVSAGKTTFNIVNASKRTLEWEILDGVMVVEERENIPPGFSQTMSVRLSPGSYDITCGLLSNPRGKLVVLPSDASQAEAAKPSLVNYVGPLAEYKVYLAMQGSALQKAAVRMADAIGAGDLDGAREAYGPAHQAYSRIEALASLFADLDARLNGRAQYYEKREADPQFSGFHRIAYGLYGQNGPDGLQPVVQQLLADIDTLRQRLRGLALEPRQIATPVARLLERLAGDLDSGQADAYDRDVLSDIEGTLDGARKAVSLLSPLLQKSDPDLLKRIEQRGDDASALLRTYANDIHEGAFDEKRRQALAKPIRALAEEVAKINAALGIE